ncbi:DUF4386 domain-containing protein [Galbibacter sp. EGI 63066]|uniref:DUF4386 domain-containing protein n=1 Tax=Galbibacter sp. EGI 63066 TaxID=2993559 RepID=UPI0022491E71|nr:DUF4386 domain-containing protein [Galbibacter sp. EGI 63066]MCX2681128.1 DUF4386 domain-containing protein [Galbibacter sp. EGI 63066]
MNSRKKTARTAGLWYLLLAIAGGFGTMYVPLNITVSGDASATVQNIVDSGWIYQLSIVSSLAGNVFFIFLALTLYRLFKDVDSKQARLLVTLVSVSVPITFLSTLALVPAEMIASGTNYLSVFDISEQNAMALWAVNLFDQGILFVKIFWGLWLLPFGILVIKSEFIPKIFGILLVMNCFAYLITAFVSLMEIQLMDVFTYILIPFLVMGEFSIIFWLLIKGAKETSTYSVSTNI